MRKNGGGDQEDGDEEAKEKRAERRGQKREADGDGMEEESAKRRSNAMEEEEARGEKRKAKDEGLQEHEEAGGDGMTVFEAVCWLDREKVREARMEEVGYMKTKLLWDEVSRSDASGHRIVSGKWVDTNRGTENKPEIRCRLVARDFRRQGQGGSLCGCTTVGAEEAADCRTRPERSNGKTRKMLLIDVKKAHLNSECTEDVFIELPEEVGAAKGKVGKLRRWLYGFRPAAAAWEAHYANKLEEVGLRRGLATPVSFYHEENDVNLVVHGDDFTFTGDDASLRWVEELMSKVKVRARLALVKMTTREATLLGRIVRWEAWGISCEANPKYRESVLEDLGLKEDSKSLMSPGTRDADRDDDFATEGTWG